MGISGSTPSTNSTTPSIFGNPFAAASAAAPAASRRNAANNAANPGNNAANPVNNRRINNPAAPAALATNNAAPAAPAAPIEGVSSRMNGGKRRRTRRKSYRKRR